MANHDDKASADENDFVHRAKSCDIVRFTFSDMNGLPRTKLVNGTQVDYFIKNGLAFWAGTLALGPQSEITLTKEVVNTNHANAVALPDPATFHEVKWADQEGMKVGEVLCETQWIHNHSPQGACPRFVARKQLQQLEQLGYKLKSTFELEFILLNPVTLLPICNTIDFMSRRLLAPLEKIFSDLCKHVAGAEIHVETINTEYSQGQIEFTLRKVYGIKAADNAFIMKHAIKETCMKKDLLASFMTRPHPHQICFNGNGLHFNHSLWSINDENAFYQDEAQDRLSQVFGHWIGGLVQHASAMSLLCMPTINCYRRAHKPWAPDVADWNLDDRTTTFRVKNYSPQATYIENRIPSGSCNPYLALAVTVAAGIDGIRNKLPCPPVKDQNAMKLPSTLSEAINALEEDHVICDALGQQFVEWFVQIKKEQEINVMKDLHGEKLFKKERETYIHL